MQPLVTAILASFGALALAAQAGPIREIEVTPDPEDGGQQVFTVRLRPGETRTYDTLAFACAYRQEFIRQTTENTGAKTVIEPAVFTHRRKAVRLVDDLDAYISFRVPMDRRKLQDMYGQTTFHPTAPIAIARITITAFTADGQAWSFEVPASGLHPIESPPAPPVPPAPARP